MDDRVIPLSKIEHRLEQIAALIQRLTVEHQMLLDLADTAVTMSAPEQNRNGGSPRNKGTTKAILALVDEEPGVKVAEVANRLHEQIESKSANRWRLVYNMADQLAKRGKIRKDKEGRLFTNASGTPNGMASNQHSSTDGGL